MTNQDNGAEKDVSIETISLQEKMSTAKVSQIREMMAALIAQATQNARIKE